VLIAGGLTIDRFADGTTAPGGSVLHAGLAAAAEGAEPTFLTVAGDEPAARAGVDRLRALGDVIHQGASRTTAYRHDESGPRRVLVLDASGDSIDPAAAGRLPPAEIALLAPIADELPPAAIRALRSEVRPRLTVLLIQGWLRRLVVGEPVRPLTLDEVDVPIWQAFAEADAIVVSTEDLADGTGDPFTQAARLRRRVGRRPLLVLTLGPDGYLLDDPAAHNIVASVPRAVVTDVPMVGAGDTFGATLALHLARGSSTVAAAEAATERVIAVLESRR
jgi:sugar/nucleoside kinase (ribokinase family)